MTTVLEDELYQLERDTKWLHAHYNELIDMYNEEFVAVKNEDVIRHEKDWERLKFKLEKIGIKPSEILIEYIRDKRNQLT